MATTTSHPTAPRPALAGRSRIGVLVPADEAGGFVVGAVTAVAGLTGATGVDLDLRRSPVDAPDPAWTGVLCHGGQWTSWLREHDVPASCPVVLTDRVPLTGPDDPLARVTMVDWHWDQAAYLAGVLAAHLAARVADDVPVGLVAGPPVPTQRRVVAAFTRGVRERGSRGEVLVGHTGAFEDITSGGRLGALLAGSAGCVVVCATADEAGEEACRRARTAGARTIGFIEPLGAHDAVIDSDVAGVVARLLTGLATGERLPSVHHAGLDSGHLDLVVADPALADVLDPYRPAAADL